MKTMLGRLFLIGGFALGIFSAVTIHNDMKPDSVFDIVYTYKEPFTEHEVSMIALAVFAVIAIVIGLILFKRNNSVSQNNADESEKSFVWEEEYKSVPEENDIGIQEEIDVNVFEESNMQIAEEDDIRVLETNHASVVECPKCGGPNDCKNEICQFCDYRFKVEDRYAKNEEEYSDEFLGRALIGGLFFVGGILALIYGSYLNNDMEAVGEYMWNYGRSDPGMKWIVGGGIGAFVGVIIFIWKRICYELTKYAQNEEVQAKSASTCKKEKQTEYSSVETVAAYHIVVNGQATGPYSMETLMQMVDSGQITGNTLVWKNGMTEWVKAAEIEKLNALFITMPPIPPSE